MVGYGAVDGSMAENRKAVSGYAFIINGGSVSWSVKHQEIISLSTTKRKYIAATYSGSKKCSNVCLFLKNQIGVIF